MGVQLLKWIMAKRLGKCPSLAPEKHSLSTQITSTLLWIAEQVTLH